MGRAAYSKGEINRAGDLLAAEAAGRQVLDADVRAKAMARVGYWRSAHLEPLKTTLEVVEDVCGRDSSTVLVSRLKRIETTINKLNRPGHSFSLKTLRDIAGARLIVESDDDMLELHERLKECRYFYATIDHMSMPDKTGYRSMHVVYRLDAPSSGYRDLKVEIQLRSRLQHAWATAVEAHDIISGTSLKFGMGSLEELEYFRLVSDLMHHDFSDEDSCKRRLSELEGSLHILDRFKMAMNSMYIVDEEPPLLSRSDSCLITVIPEVQEISLEVFPSNREDEATRRYTELESGPEEGAFYLLARAGSFSDLKRAYPNYYFNISEFVNWLDGCIGCD